MSKSLKNKVVITLIALFVCCVCAFSAVTFKNVSAEGNSISLTADSIVIYGEQNDAVKFKVGSEEETLRFGLQNGASVRISDNSGIRFSTFMSKEDYDALVSKYGESNVKVGTILVLTKGHDTPITFESEKNYVLYNVIASNTIVYDEGETLIRYSAVMTQIPSTDFITEISARSYVKVYYQGVDYIGYSAYSHENNSRDIARVSAGILDMQAFKESISWINSTRLQLENYASLIDKTDYVITLSAEEQDVISAINADPLFNGKTIENVYDSNLNDDEPCENIDSYWISNLGGQNKVVSVYTDDGDIYKVTLSIANEVITSVEQFKSIFTPGLDSHGKYYTLGANLDFNGEDITSNTGYAGCGAFFGTFDGKGYAIVNAKFTHGLFAGLDTTGVIKNLLIINPIKAAANGGAIIANDSKGKIENCVVIGSLDATNNNQRSICYTMWNGAEIKDCFTILTGKALSSIAPAMTSNPNDSTATKVSGCVAISAIPDTTGDVFDSVYDFESVYGDINTYLNNKGFNSVEFALDKNFDIDLSKAENSFDLTDIDASMTNANNVSAIYKDGISVPFTKSGSVITINGTSAGLTTKNVGALTINYNGTLYVVSSFVADLVIKDTADLTAFAVNFQSKFSKSNQVITLGNDIDATGFNIGSVSGSTLQSVYFYGTFDGRGFTIKNLTVANGLLGAGSYGTVKNLVMLNTHISSQAGGTIANLILGGKVENVCVLGTIFTGNQQGGIANKVNGGEVKNCVITGETGTEMTSNWTWLPGFVGTTYAYNNGTGNTLTNVYGISRSLNLFWATTTGVANNCVKYSTVSDFEKAHGNLNKFISLLVGRETSYYDKIIYTVEDFKEVFNATNNANSKGKVYALGNNIDFKGEDITSYTGIPAGAFNGTLDGNGYAVINAKYTHGFISSLGANGTIRNLALINPTKATNGGGLLCNECYGTVENCFIYGNTTAASHYGIAPTGTPNVKNCFVIVGGNGAGSVVANGGNTSNTIAISTLPFGVAGTNGNVLYASIDAFERANGDINDYVVNVLGLNDIFFNLDLSYDIDISNTSNEIDVTELGINANDVKSVTVSFVDKPFTVSGNKLIVDGASLPIKGNTVLTVSTGDKVFFVSAFVADLIIKDASGLTEYGTNISKYYQSGKLVALANDIDATEVTALAQETTNAQTAHTFDGRGYTISNLAVKYGLMGIQTNGTLKNIVLKNCSTTRNNMGIVARYLFSQGVIENCVVINPTFADAGGGAFVYSLGSSTTYTGGTIRNSVSIVSSATNAPKLITADAYSYNGVVDNVKCISGVITGKYVSYPSYNVTEINTNVYTSIKAFEKENGNLEAYLSNVVGRETSYYDKIIYTVEDFKEVFNATNNATSIGKVYALGNNIDFKGEDITNYTGIPAGAFNGTLEGNGYAVINAKYTHGFISSLGTNGTIRNLALINPTKATNGGGLLCNECYGTVENCFIFGNTTAASHYGIAPTGTPNVKNCLVIVGGNGAGSVVANGGKTSNTIAISTLPFGVAGTNGNALYASIEEFERAKGGLAKYLDSLGINVEKFAEGFALKVNTSYNELEIENLGVKAEDVVSIIANKELSFSVKGNKIIVDTSAISTGYSGNLYVATKDKFIIANVCIANLIIENVEDLKAFAVGFQSIYSQKGSVVALGKDIDATGLNIATVSGSTIEKVYYHGTFDGMGHSISNVSFKNGFFGTGIYGTIKNFALINPTNVEPSTPATTKAGKFASYIFGSALITDCLLDLTFDAGNAIWEGGIGYKVGSSNAAGCFGGMVSNIVVIAHGGNKNVDGMIGTNAEYNINSHIQNIYGVTDSDLPFWVTQDGTANNCQKLTDKNALNTDNSITGAKAVLGGIGYWNVVDGKLFFKNTEVTTLQVKEEKYIVKDNETDYTIVVPENASDKEVYAAKELAKYIELSTKASLRVKRENKIVFTNDSKYIFIGATQKATQLGFDFSEATLTSQGFKIVTSGNSLFIMGGGDLGTVFGVYGFLEQVIGFDAIAIDEILFDKVNNIKLEDFDIVDIPDFEYRLSGDVQTYNDSNLAYLFREARTYYDTFMMIDGTYLIHHTSFYFLPTETYNDSALATYHPDWYSQPNTQGLTDMQLCYTAHGNQTEYESMLNTAFDVLKATVNNNPTLKLVQFSIQDSTDGINHSCTCATCQSWKTNYGSDSASVVHFLNDLRDKLDAWLSQENIDREIDILFLAYNETIKAPVSGSNGVYEPITNALNGNEPLICKDGVYPILCGVNDVNFASLKDSVNTDNLNELKKWATISDKVFYWSYSTSFASYLSPYAIFDNMQDTYKALKENGVFAIFPEGQHYNTTPVSSSFAIYKEYLQSKLGWDVNVDVDALTDKFFTEYFKDAAPAMRNYFDALCAYSTAENMQNANSFSEDVRHEVCWNDKETVKWLSFIDDAYKAIEYLKDQDLELYEVLKNRIDIEAICVRFVYLSFFVQNYEPTKVDALRRQFKNDIQAFGIIERLQGHEISELWTKWGI